MDNSFKLQLNQEKKLNLPSEQNSINFMNNKNFNTINFNSVFHPEMNFDL